MDRLITKDRSKLPPGTYNAKWGGYVLTIPYFDNPYDEELNIPTFETLATIDGVRGQNCSVVIVIDESGFVYEKRSKNIGNYDEG